MAYILFNDNGPVQATLRKITSAILNQQNTPDIDRIFTNPRGATTDLMNVCRNSKLE